MLTTCYLASFIKFRFSEKATKIGKKVPPLFWIKVARWKKQKLNCLFLWLCVYIFKNSPQFLRHWESGQCFAVRNSVFFLTKTKRKAWLSVWGRKIQVCWELCIPKHFFHRATSKCQTKWDIFFKFCGPLTISWIL